MIAQHIRMRSAMLGVALLAAPLGLALAQSSNVVLLAIDADESALVYNANGSSHGRCQMSTEPGCIRVSGKAQITFRLVSNRQCASGADWELSGVQLGGEGSMSKPASWGGLSQVAAADFNADAQTGMIPTGRGNSVTIEDANSQAYSLWYRVVASCEGRQIYFDPRLENDGTGEAPRS